MIVKTAKAIARQWVLEEISSTPGFYGAFFHGSINWLPDDAFVPATSDVDIMVVFDDPPPVKLGKFIYRDLMLEVSYMSPDRLQSSEAVLGEYNMAGSFRRPSVIADPSGQLTELQIAVSKDYAKRRWVYKRCQQARDKVLHGVSLRETDPFPEQVMAWLFPAGITTHVLLVAGLKNPTVRQRYVAVRDLLAEYGYQTFHETLLSMLGCTYMSQAQVETHLTALTAVFDVAKTVVKTPFFFASDISDIARPIAIDGSRSLIERGYHREAIFWIGVTYSRCQLILGQDASEELRDRFNPGYQNLLADLGITSFSDLQRRREVVNDLLPQVWAVAEMIMAANPEIED